MRDDKTPPDEPEIPVEVEAPVAAAKAAADVPETAEQRTAALEAEKKDLHERLLRTAADFDNFRKRARKDVDDARASARESVLKEMLPVIDNLERALASTTKGGGNEGVIEGVKLVLKQFQSALERFDVKTFESVGQPFDPAKHEAISQIETADHPAGSVAAEMMKGYMMGTRLLRPAMVAVAKAPASQPLPNGPEASPEAGD